MKRREAFLAVAALFSHSRLATTQSKVPRRPEKVRDPVCGLMVEKDAEMSATYNGRTYYFCSKADRDVFRKNPGKYVK
jgi:YHS domain-containing protein